MAPNQPSSDAALWRDVCLASAWLHRAQAMHGGPPAAAAAGDDATAAAERALALYQSCLGRVKRRSSYVGGSGATTATASPSSMSRSESSSSKKSQQVDNSRRSSSNSSSWSGADGRAFTVCVELRMAQTLRFLALVHAAAHRSHSSAGTTNAVGGNGGNGNGDNVDSENAEENVHLDAAIKYHDMAVSLLVGVYDDGEAGESGNSSVNARNGEPNSNGIESREPTQEAQDVQRQEGMENCSTESFSREMIGSNNQGGVGGRVMFTISLPKDEILNQYTLQPHQTNDATTISSPTTQAVSSMSTQANFLFPTEDQRVRAIAVSLNALADLHARRGDDRAAMDSYREALEILRAANEVGQEELNESNNVGGSDDAASPRRVGRKAIEGLTSQSSTINGSPVQADLANTLMNVGNFHLRRDELNAALNAYSTVWALHSGKSLDDATQTLDPPAAPSGPGDGGSAAELPYLSRRGVHTPRAGFSTPRPLGDNDNDDNDDRSHSPGALAALNNLGIVHERRGELREALACFEGVHRARSEVLGRDHVDAVNALVNIGNCRQRLQDWEGAGGAYGEAVGAYRKMLRRTPSDPPGSGVEALTLRRALAGALRNWGTCHWRHRRIPAAINCLNGAVEAEGEIAALLSRNGSAVTGGGAQDRVRQAKESAAQLLGLLGCLHMEYNHAQSFDKSEFSFRKAIQLYEELGYDANHPSIIWARHNLGIIGQQRVPPPPPMPSPTPSTPPQRLEEGANGQDIDGGSVELDRALETDDEDNDAGDEGSEQIFANSTDELDQFFSEHVAPKTEEGKRPVEDQDVDEAAPTQSNPAMNSPVFLEEVDLDEGVIANANQAKTHAGVNEGLSTEHRISSSQLSGQGQIKPKHDQDNDLDERLSQLQLKTTGSDENDNLEAAHAHEALAEHFWEKGDRASATEHYTEAHAIYRSRLGDSSEPLALVLKKLGDLNREDGILDAAKELYGAALEMELTVRGQYLPATLNAAGAACLANDDFRSAMEFHRRALQIQKKVSQEGAGRKGQGRKYEMYETLVRIGDVYYSERNNFTHIKSNGVDYREFIESGFLRWIANAHDMRGEYVKAIHFYEESLQILMTQKGKEAKRETALTLNRLGSLTTELGRYDEAMDYHRRALGIQKSGSGVAKAMTAETCVLMGVVKSKVGEFESALNLYEDSLLVLKNSLGENHPSSWTTMAHIGSLHFELSNYEQAMKILLETEQWQLSSGGEENRDTLETQALIGRVLTATGRHETALIKLRGVYTLSYIGECFLDQEGMATEARLQFVDCYNMRKFFFASDQIHIAKSMVDIIRARSGQPERALAIYKNAMDVYKEYLSDDHVLIGRLHVYAGDSHAELHNFSEAIERYEQSSIIFQKAFGAGASDSALVAVNIGKVLLRKCDYDSAKTSFTSALDIYKQILPEGHQKITSTLSHLDRVEQEEALCV